MSEPAPSPRRHALPALFALVAIVVAVLFALTSTRPPAPVPASAPAAEFSSARALAHLAVIAARPHRMGSPAHAEVRRYLERELAALGLAPEVQETTVQGAGSRLRFATVKNVVARRKGTASGKALLLMAHYDTRSMTPGAADDGAGVVTLLETARALGAGEPLRSDVIFLITDGEEEGLLGARAFVAEHPWARDVGLVLNFEARGDRGPVLMFQTSDDAGELIAELQRSAPYPVASSLLQAVYERMPNGTDLSEWLPGTPGLNFANIEGAERYHAPTDTVANLDEGTLQHHGSYALSLARAFGARVLPVPAAPAATYFNVGAHLVRYPQALRWPVAGASVALVAIFVALGVRRGALTARGAGLSAAAALASVVAAALACQAAWVIAQGLHPAFVSLYATRPAMKGLHLASFFAIGVAVCLALLGRVSRGLRPAEIFAGGGAVWGVLAIASAAWLPGGAYLFAWPLLLTMGLGLGLLRASRLEADDPLGAALRAATAIPGIVVLLPLAMLIFAAFGPAGAGVVGALVALVLALAAPAMLLVTTVRLAPMGAAAAAIALLVAANASAAFDADHPRPDTLVLAVDQDHQKSYWLSPDAAPDVWTGHALAGAKRGPSPLPFPLRTGGEIVAVEAPRVTEPGPAIGWADDVTTGGTRSVRVRVVVPSGAEVLAVSVEPPLTSARVQGKAASLGRDGGLAFSYSAPPPAGVELILETRSRAPVTVRALTQRSGFPGEVAASLGPRPAGVMPRPGWASAWDELLESDMTLVAATSSR